MRKRLRNAIICLVTPMLALALAGCSSNATSENGASAAGAASSQGSASANAGAGATSQGGASSQSAPNNVSGSLTSFTAQTLTGETFTQDDFAEYDLTMVNLWATFCGFCIDEMPGIEKLYNDLPSNVNIIGICADASTNRFLAGNIVDECGITFPTLVDNSELEKCLLNYVTGFPTTVFVDSKGNIVGDAQIGAPAQGTDETIAQEYRALINEHLEELQR